MKQIIVLAILFLPLLSRAQNENKGIKFENGLTWEQIKAKAKEENKYIFVDCYATWCKPCKEMDKNVYPNDKVGEYMNNKFISVKVQMDTAKNDNDNVRLTYATARELGKKYKINGLPTFLSFTADGNAVHKEMGGQTVKDFMTIVQDATKLDKQLYTLISYAHSGKLSYNAMPELAKKLKAINEDTLALDMAKEYMHRYLDKLSKDSFLKKENLEFFRTYTRAISTKDRIFKLYYEQPDKVDSIMVERGYAKARVNFIITIQEIQPIVIEADKAGVTPSWKNIQLSIKKKFNKEYAVYNVLNEKLNWYRYKKQWKYYCKSLIQKWRIYGDEFGKYGSDGLNGLAWTVAVHSNNKKQLAAALKWSSMAISMDKNSAGNMDTKANILYKLGLKDEAIALETLVVELFQAKFKNDQIGYDLYVPGFQSILDKMRKGESVKLED